MDTARENKGASNAVTAIWAITPGGIRLGERLGLALESSVLFAPEKEAQFLTGQPDQDLKLFKKLGDEIARQFRSYSAHVFVFSTGISVRIISPLLTSKTQDPAVVVVDEKGLHAISLVSGHLGGANALAKNIAALIGAVPVITTATDINDLPSIDMIARKKNLHIENPGAIKYVNMNFLKGRPIKVHDPGAVLAGLIPEALLSPGERQAVFDLVVTHEQIKVPRETLVLRPRILSVGIGCNRNTSEADIYDLLKSTLESNNLSLNAITSIGTTEVKKDEKGLLDLADTLGCELLFYTKEQLNNVDTVQNPSKMAEKYLGVKSVCEAAALLGAKAGPLIIPKQKTKDVTVAVAIMK